MTRSAPPHPRVPTLVAAVLGSIGGLALFCDLGLHAFGALDRGYFLVAIVMAVCLLGVPAAYWLRGGLAGGWRRGVGAIGTGLVVVGSTAWITAFVILYDDPDAAFTQRLTPLGSMLMALGLTLLGVGVLASGRVRGLRRVAPLVAGLYFPAQLAVQLTFFLGGKDAAPGPNGLLLGAWGLFWVWAAWTAATAPSIESTPASTTPSTTPRTIAMHPSSQHTRTDTSTFDVVFATTPADGHTVPALPIAAALVERGHRVRWYAGHKYADRIQAVGAEYLPMSGDDYSVVGLDEFFPERAALSGIAKLKFDLNIAFARSARTHLADLRAVLERDPADLIVGDTALIAGPMLTELEGPPFAAFGISVVGFPSRDVAPFGLGLRPTNSALGTVRNRVLQAVVRRTLFADMSRTVNQIRADIGLPPRDEIVFEYMLHASLYLQLGAEGFEYAQRDLPEHVRFVGPVRPQPIQDWTEPAWWSDLDAGKPVVVLNQGTVATDPTELLLPGLTALAREDVLVVAVTGGRDPRELGPLPANARVERFIPFDHLLPRADVLVTNAGFGAIQLALAAGVPIVAAGETEDKVEVAARVGWSGVGINLRTQRPRPAAIAAAVRQVLGEDRYRRRATELRDQIDAAGRERAAADELEKLLSGSDLRAGRDRSVRVGDPVAPGARVDARRQPGALEREETLSRRDA